MNSSKRCPHSSHGFKVYGVSTYRDSTCAKCILSAYAQSRKSRQFSNGNQYSNIETVPVRDEKPCDLIYNSKSPTPVTDTVSHFPSPGGEVQHGIFQPHLPLINAEDEIRPSEIANFREKLSKTPVEALDKSKSQDLIKVEDEKFPDAEGSVGRKQIIEIEYGKSLLNDREKLKRLTTLQFYKTSTQRFYEGVDWATVLSKSKRNLVLPAPRHDTSELEGQLKRYNTSRESYQKLTEMTNWDTVQSRDGFYVRGPIAYISESKKVHQIPDYKGTTGGFGEKDVENEKFFPLTVMRTDQPKYATPSWKPYIPGYTGCVSQNKSSDVFSKEPFPRLESTARVHSRFNTYPQNVSKYSHQSALSNSVTLTHPYNPYNKMSKAEPVH